MNLKTASINLVLLSSLASVAFSSAQATSVNYSDITNALKSKNPKDVVTAFLSHTSKNEVAYAAEQLVDKNATYVSLSFNNPELQQIEPWTGTRRGREIYVNTFKNVGTYWNVNAFKITDVISEGDSVAVFGQFDYTSVIAKNNFKSPFSILAKVNDGKIVFFQFMEDTYASASSFRTSGKWTIQHKEGGGNKFQVGK